jgi:multidrug resistance efflux pump
VEAKKVAALRAKRDFERLEALYADQLVSRQALERAVADRDITSSDLDQAKRSLAALSEIRVVDRDVAEARVAIEVATVVKAKSELELLRPNEY